MFSAAPYVPAEERQRTKAHSAIGTSQAQRRARHTCIPRGNTTVTFGTRFALSQSAHLVLVTTRRAGRAKTVAALVALRTQLVARAVSHVRPLGSAESVRGNSRGGGRSRAAVQAGAAA